MSEEKRLNEIKEIGFVPCKLLHGKPVKIKSFHTTRNGFMVFLESKYDESYDYEVKSGDIEKFLSNFSFSDISIAQPLSNIMSTRNVLMDTVSKLEKNEITWVKAKKILSVCNALLESSKLEFLYKNQASGGNSVPKI